MSAVLSLAKPHRIKASHRRRWKGMTGHSVYIGNNPLSGTDPTGYLAEGICMPGDQGCASSGVSSMQNESTMNSISKKFAFGGNGNSKQSSQTKSTEKDMKGESSAKGENKVRVSGEEYKKNLKSFWKKTPINEKGYSNNKQVAEVGKKVNSKPVTLENVEASDSQRSFIKDIAKPTYSAQQNINDPASQNEFVLELSGGRTSTNDIETVSSARVPQGGQFDLKSADSFLVHWHYEGLEQQPSVGDHSAAKAGIPSFVVTPDKSNRCCSIWEVGVKNSKPVYRDISRDKPSDWKKRDEWK